MPGTHDSDMRPFPRLAPPMHADQAVVSHLPGIGHRHLGANKPARVRDRVETFAAIFLGVQRARVDTVREGARIM
jgi:hypothetical protein